MTALKERTEYPEKRERGFIIRARDVFSVPVSEIQIQDVERLMSPTELLTRVDFDVPEAIDPTNYPDFASLLENRERIRTLSLLPVKRDEQRQRYKAESQESLVDHVNGFLDGDSMVFAPNEFLYSLPTDIDQNFVWIRDHTESNREVARFVARCMEVMHMTSSQVILFERPFSTDAKLIKRTMPQFRHIHFWYPAPGFRNG